MKLYMVKINILLIPYFKNLLSLKSLKPYFLEIIKNLRYEKA